MEIAELVEKEITENHPKVKEIMQNFVVEAQEKTHQLRENQIQEVFWLEKQLQEMRFGKESAEKDLEAKKVELESYVRERSNAM